MIETVYVEDGVAAHPRTAQVLARLRPRRVVACRHYGEIFNRHNQNFRLQKAHPSLILAAKTQRRLLPVPAGYGLSGDRGYYFSHMLNCLYDCRYCFLQGMFRSAHYVLFVNYADFEDDIRAACAATSDDCWLFSGYDCDSLALEPVTAFARTFVPTCAAIGNAWLELRTKSTQIRSLLAQSPNPRCVCAFSLSPAPIVQAFEHRTPSLRARLAALARLQAHGWPLGLRFDPLVPVAGFHALYRAFFDEVFAVVDAARVHSVTLGTPRLPRAYARTMARLYPDEPLFAQAFDERHGLPGCRAEVAADLLACCHDEIARRIDGARIFRQAA